MINKSNLTNFVSLLIVIVGVLSDFDILLMVGLFALSGSITNTLAIHMLFHKVPLLYGSGVIEENFVVFKKSIYTLIMKQFFTLENIEKFLDDEKKNNNFHGKILDIIEKTDFSPAYLSLKSAVMESQFGGMLGMFGGEKVLEPLKEPFEKKLRVAIMEIVQSDSFKQTFEESLSNDEMKNKMLDDIGLIVELRLNELNPMMVKELIEQIIKEHLGWLVLWGGVIGGLIGFVSGVVFG